MRELRVRLIGRLLYGLWLRYPRLRDRIDARMIRFFDRRAAEWDEATGALLPTRLTPLEAGLAQMASDPRRAADIGTGTGAGALLLARSYPTAWIEGIDPSMEMLAQARATANNLGIAVRFSDGTADAVPAKRDSTDLLTYVNAPVDFHEAARVLRQGGAMIVCFTSGDRTPFFAPPPTLRKLAKRAGLVSAGAGGSGAGEFFVATKPVRSSAAKPPERPLLAPRNDQVALIAHIPGAAKDADSTQPFERPAELLIARRRKFKPFAATSLEAVEQAAGQAASRGELALAYGDGTVAAQVFKGAAGKGSIAAWFPTDLDPLAHELGLVDDLPSVADLLIYGTSRPLGAIGLGRDRFAFRLTAQPVSDDRGPRAELHWPGGGATINGPFEAISTHRDPLLSEGVLLRPLAGGKSPNMFEPFVVTSAALTFKSFWQFEADGREIVQPPTELSYKQGFVDVIAPAAAYAR